MVEFSGYLTGDAERRYAQKERKVMLIIFTVALVIVTLPLIIEGIKAKNLFIIGMCAAFWPIFLGIPLIASNKKNRRKNMAEKIVVEDDCITAITNTIEETRLLSDVLNVFDCGEYYEITFVGLRICYKFICQKSLLNLGSLEEFEGLFEEKIIRLTQGGDKQ